MNSAFLAEISPLGKTNERQDSSIDHMKFCGPAYYCEFEAAPWCAIRGTERSIDDIAHQAATPFDSMRKRRILSRDFNIDGRKLGRVHLDDDASDTSSGL